MIRYARHRDIDYIVVDSTLEVDGVVASIQVQVNIQNMKQEDKSKIFRVVSAAFDRPLNFNKAKPQEKKSWWKRIINV